MTPWVIIGAFVVLFCVMLYRMEQHKKTIKELTAGDFDQVQLERFADVTLPGGLDDSKSDRIARNLRAIKRVVYQQCNKIYGVVGDVEWVVDKIAVVVGEVHERHPEVMWSRGAGRIVLRYQKSMYYWFAREIHNVYHSQIGAVEEDRWNLVETWITQKFGSKAGGR